jgi:hypothetical protein
LQSLGHRRTDLARQRLPGGLHGLSGQRGRGVTHPGLAGELPGEAAQRAGVELDRGRLDAVPEPSRGWLVVAPPLGAAGELDEGLAKLLGLAAGGADHGVRQRHPAVPIEVRVRERPDDAKRLLARHPGLALAFDAVALRPPGTRAAAEARGGLVAVPPELLVAPGQIVGQLGLGDRRQLRQQHLERRGALPEVGAATGVLAEGDELLAGGEDLDLVRLLRRGADVARGLQLADRRRGADGEQALGPRAVA